MNNSLGNQIFTNTKWDQTRNNRRSNSESSTVQGAISKERSQSANSNAYTIQAGDTLWDLAESLKQESEYSNMSITGIIDKVSELNNIKDPSNIKAGQQLKLSSNSKNSTVQPEPVKTNAGKNSATQNNSPGSVVVIDSFKADGKTDHDNDGIVDNISHGEIVSSFIDNHNVNRVEHAQTKIGDQLADVRKRAENGEKISAINLSQGYPMKYEALSSGLEKEVTPENIKEHAPEIIAGLREEASTYPQAINELNTEKTQLEQQLKNVDTSTAKGRQQANDIQNNMDQINGKINQMNYLSEVVQVYDEVDKLADMGIPVVISSGNNTEEFNSQNSVNMYTLNERAITIGSTDPLADETNSKPAFFSYNNSLVDANLTGVFRNQWVDPSVSSKLSGTGSTNPMDGIVNGTSYSAPMAADIAATLGESNISVDKMNKIFEGSEEIAQKENTNSQNVLGAVLSRILGT